MTTSKKGTKNGKEQDTSTGFFSLIFSSSSIKTSILIIVIGSLILKIPVLTKTDLLGWFFVDNQYISLVLVCLISIWIIIKGNVLFRHNYLLVRWSNLIPTLTILIFISSLNQASIHFTSYLGLRIILIPVIILMFLICALLIKNILFLREVRDTQGSYEGGFIYEEPISDTSDFEDNYRRNVFAKALISKIRTTRVRSGSLGIGISGQWGSGKTSLLYLIKAELKEESEITIDYNPWKSGKANNITNDFFELLQNELSKRSSALSYRISKYTSRLLSNSNLYTRIVDGILPNPSAETLFNRINESFGEIKSRVYVFVDDLDRLDQDEVLSVFKLIRNTGNFKNLVFIVAYDRVYLEKIIDNKYDADNYIKKILNVELPLPQPPFAIFKKDLQSKVKGVIRDEKEFQALARYLIPDDAITYIILINDRDILKFVNSFSFNYSMYYNRVATNKLFLLELLKLYNIRSFQRLYSSFRSLGNVDLPAEELIKRLKRNFFDGVDTESDTYHTMVKLIDEILKKTPIDSLHSDICITRPTTFEYYFNAALNSKKVDTRKLYDLRRDCNVTDSENILSSMAKKDISGLINWFEHIRVYDNSADFE